jgi:hypothetical protein
MRKKFEDFTREDLKKLRSEIRLNSLFYHDYENSFEINRKSVALFFDSYIDFLWEEAEEKYGSEGIKDMDISIMFKEFDNIDNLESWYGCYEGFDWVEYDYNDDEDC